MKKNIKFDSQGQNELNIIFDKYANKYNIDKEPVNSKQADIDRQKYIYLQIHKKGLSNTNIEKLLNLVIEDIQHQYSLKQDMENKVGFITALCGILIVTIMQQEVLNKLILNILDNKLTSSLRILNSVIIVCLAFSGMFSLLLIAKALLVGEYSKYLFDDKELNFKCAVDDKYMSLVRLLDSNTTVWIKNEEANEKKYKTLRLLVIWSIIFIVFTVISFCL